MRSTFYPPFLFFVGVVEPNDFDVIKEEACDEQEHCYNNEIVDYIFGVSRNVH